MTRRLLPVVLLAACGLAGCSHTETVADTPTQGDKTTQAMKDDVFSEAFWRDPAAQADDPKFVVSKPIKGLAHVFRSQAADGTVTYCGELLYGENNRFATDLKTVPYSMRVDCNSNGEVDEADGIHMALFDGVKPAQKGHITRWRQQAAQAHGVSGVPYICFRGQASVDPCSTMKTATVQGASFSSLYKKVLAQLNAAKKN